MESVRAIFLSDLFGTLLQGPLQAFPTLVEMMRSEGWTDIGADSAKCGGRLNQPTCHTNATANETRIDYVIANEYFTPAIKTFKVDLMADYPTHRPIKC